MDGKSVPMIGGWSKLAMRRPAPRMSAIGVRHGKAAFFSGCKSRPAIAPAGSNRSSHGGDEMAEAFGIACHELVSRVSREVYARF